MILWIPYFHGSLMVVTAWEKGLTPGGPHSFNVISVHISAAETALYQHTPSQVVCLWVHFISSLWKDYVNTIMTLPGEIPS